MESIELCPIEKIIYKCEKNQTPSTYNQTFKFSNLQAMLQKISAMVYASCP